MIQLTPQMRILVALEPADFRRGIDGLASVCKETTELAEDTVSVSRYGPVPGKNAKRSWTGCQAVTGTLVRLSGIGLALGWLGERRRSQRKPGFPAGRLFGRRARLRYINRSKHAGNDRRQRREAALALRTSFAKGDQAMRPWYLFSSGIVFGLLLAVGFGFTFPGEAPPTNPEASFPHLPTPPPRPLGAIVESSLSTEYSTAKSFAGQPVRPDDGKLGIIVFGAHPDDCEIRAGGAAALWSKAGHAVKMVSMTNGDIGHWAMAGGPLALRRNAEVQAAAKILGVTTEVLDIHDGELMPTLENRKIMTRLIRQWNADIVIGHRPNDYHPDHRYTGVLMQDTAYMVAVPFLCPDTPPMKKNPVFLYSFDNFKIPNPFRPDVVVAIDAVIEQKIDALATMESQFIEGGATGNASRMPKNEEERKAAFDR
jgi:LmbE family N-acetylglucosaminyl deacetylase